MNLSQKLGLASALFGTPTTSQTSTVQAKALGASEDGSLLVQIGEEEYDEDGNVIVPASDLQMEIPIIGAASEDEEITVLVSDGQPTGIAGAGWGDRVQTSVTNAETAAQQAQELAESVTAHFWEDTNGAHVTSYEQADDATATGFEALISAAAGAAGMLIRRVTSGVKSTLASFTQSAVNFYDDAGDVLASFGETVQIGKDTAPHMTLDSTGTKIISGNGDLRGHFLGNAVRFYTGSASAGTHRLTCAVGYDAARGSSSLYSPDRALVLYAGADATTAKQVTITTPPTSGGGATDIYVAFTPAPSSGNPAIRIGGCDVEFNNEPILTTYVNGSTERTGRIRDWITNHGWSSGRYIATYANGYTYYGAGHRAFARGTAGSTAVATTAGNQKLVTLVASASELDDEFTISGGGVKCAHAGRVRIDASLYYDSGNTSAYRGCYIRKNGTGTAGTEVGSSYCLGTFNPQISGLEITVAANDVLYLHARASVTGEHYYPNNNATYLRIEYI